jgi:hypothetical protein
MLIASGLPVDPVAEADLSSGLPFLEMKLVRQADFDECVDVTFAAERMGIPKGMVEVVP